MYKPNPFLEEIRSLKESESRLIRKHDGWVRFINFESDLKDLCRMYKDLLDTIREKKGENFVTEELKKISPDIKKLQVEVEGFPVSDTKKLEATDLSLSKNLGLPEKIDFVPEELKIISPSKELELLEVKDLNLFDKP